LLCADPLEDRALGDDAVRTGCIVGAGAVCEGVDVCVKRGDGEGVAVCVAFGVRLASLSAAFVALDPKRNEDVEPVVDGLSCNAAVCSGWDVCASVEFAATVSADKLASGLEPVT
jgi:hypothetical protein